MSDNIYFSLYWLKYFNNHCVRGWIAMKWIHMRDPQMINPDFHEFRWLPVPAHPPSPPPFFNDSYLHPAVPERRPLRGALPVRVSQRVDGHTLSQWWVHAWVIDAYTGLSPYVYVCVCDHTCCVEQKCIHLDGNTHKALNYLTEKGDHLT